MGRTSKPLQLSVGSSLTRNVSFIKKKHSSTVSVTILTKNMVIRNGDFIVKYISTEPGFHNGDNVRIVCFNNCTELKYKASLIVVYN